MNSIFICRQIDGSSVCALPRPACILLLRLTLRCTFVCVRLVQLVPMGINSRAFERHRACIMLNLVFDAVKSIRRQQRLHRSVETDLHIISPGTEKRAPSKLHQNHSVIAEKRQIKSAEWRQKEDASRHTKATSTLVSPVDYSRSTD